MSAHRRGHAGRLVRAIARGGEDPSIAYPPAVAEIISGIRANASGSSIALAQARTRVKRMSRRQVRELLRAYRQARLFRRRALAESIAESRRLPAQKRDTHAGSTAGATFSAATSYVSDKLSAAPLASEVTDEIRSPTKPRTKNTLRAYRASWSAFACWCGERGLTAIPATPDVIVKYLCEVRNSIKFRTVQIRIAAIAFMHELADLPSPTTSATVRAAMFELRMAALAADAERAADTEEPPSA